MYKLLAILLVIFLLAVPLVGCAAKELTLTVTEPMDGATVTKSSVTVRGEVSDAKATVVVKNTGYEGELTLVTKASVYKSRRFGAYGVTLTQGENIIKVVATRGKEEVTKTVTVTYTPSE